MFFYITVYRFYLGGFKEDTSIEILPVHEESGYYAEEQTVFEQISFEIGFRSTVFIGSFWALRPQRAEERCWLSL